MKVEVYKLDDGGGSKGGGGGGGGGDSSSEGEGKVGEGKSGERRGRSEGEFVKHSQYFRGTVDRWKMSPAPSFTIFLPFTSYHYLPSFLPSSLPAYQ